MINKLFKSVSLALVLVLALSACHTQTPQTVGTINDTQISAGIFLIHQLRVYDSAVVLAGEEELSSATIEGQTGTDYVKNETIAELQRYVWIEQNAGEDLLTADEIAQTEEYAAMNYSYATTYYADNGIGEETYIEYSLTEAKYNAMLADYTEENSEDITNELAQEYMQETYKNLSSLVFPGVKADGSELSAEEEAEIQAIASELVSDLSAGGTMEEEGKEALEKAAEIAGIEITDDLLSQYNNTSFITEESANSYYSEEEATLFMQASEGDAMLSPTSEAVVVYQIVPNFADDEEFETNYLSSIVNEMIYNDFDEIISTESATYTVSLDDNALSAYSTNNIEAY